MTDPGGTVHERTSPAGVVVGGASGSTVASSLRRRNPASAAVFVFGGGGGDQIHLQPVHHGVGHLEELEAHPIVLLLLLLFLLVVPPLVRCETVLPPREALGEGPPIIPAQIPQTATMNSRRRRSGTAAAACAPRPSGVAVAVEVAVIVALLVERVPRVQKPH